MTIGSGNWDAFWTLRPYAVCMTMSSKDPGGAADARDSSDSSFVRALRDHAATVAAKSPARIRTNAIVLAQLALFFAIATVCDAVVARMRLPIPGNALGIAVVFAMLRCGLLRLVWLEAGAALLVRHLSLFFVPIGVATIVILPSLLPILLPLGFVLVASTVLGIGATGVAAELATSAGNARLGSREQRA